MIDPYIVIFDIETTDAQISLPQIVEIGAVKLDQHLKVIDTFETFVRPADLELLTEFSEMLNGISIDNVRDAPLWGEIWRPWAEFTKFKQCRLFSWSSYDTFLLRLEYNRLRLGYPHSEMPICIASMVYMHAISKGWKPKNFSLKTICNHFGIDYKSKHRAMFDANLAANVLREIIKPETDDEPFEIYAV